MTDHAGLAAALAAVQAQLPDVRKTRTARLKGRTKAGIEFDYSYKYADLADVTAAIMPLLGANGLAFTCTPTLDPDHGFGLAYQLLHASGEAVDGWYPLDASMTPQQIGGHITYARRYCLCAVTGIAAEEDTDAREAETQAQKRPRERPPVRAKNELPRNVDGSISRSQATDEELTASGNMTAAQLRAHNKAAKDTIATPRAADRATATADDDPWYDQQPVPLPAPKTALDPAKQIIMHFARLGVGDRDLRLQYTAALAGRTDAIASTNALTAAEGLTVIGRLGKFKDKAAMDKELDREVESADDAG